MTLQEQIAALVKGYQSGVPITDTDLQSLSGQLGTVLNHPDVSEAIKKIEADIAAVEVQVNP